MTAGALAVIVGSRFSFNLPAWFGFGTSLLGGLFLLYDYLVIRSLVKHLSRNVSRELNTAIKREETLVHGLYYRAE